MVSLVAEVIGRDPTQLEPLDDVLDPDALDALFEPTLSGRLRVDRTVRFTYHDTR